MAYQPPPGHEPIPPAGSAPGASLLPPKFRPPRPPFDYGSLIKGTLGLVWRHKFLWFFGLFATGSTTTFSWSGNFSGDFSPNEDTAPSGASQFPREISDWIGAHLTLIIAAAIALVILGILIWLWSIVCRGAVIGSVEDIQEGKPSGFGAAFSRGKQSFGRLLLLDLLLLAIVVGLVMIITAVIFFFIFLAVTGATGTTIVIIILSLVALGLLGLMFTGLGYLTFFTLWFVLWVPVTLLVIYATRAIVLERAGPIEGLRQGWRLMMSTLVRTLLLFLLSTGLSIGGSIGAVMVAGLAAVPAIAAWVITGLSGWSIPGITISILLSLLPVAAILFSYALINTYFTAFWTDAYRRLMQPEREVAAASISRAQ